MSPTSASAVLRLALSLSLFVSPTLSLAQPSADAGAPSATPDSGTPSATPDSGASAPSPFGEPSRSRSAGAGPWVLLGISAAVFATAGVMLTLRQSALTDRDNLCAAPDGTCITATAQTAQTAQARQDDANTYNLVANVSAGVGSAFLLGSIIWFLFGGRARTPSSTARLHYSPGPNGNGTWGYTVTF